MGSLFFLSHFGVLPSVLSPRDFFTRPPLGRHCLCTVLYATWLHVGSRLLALADRRRENSSEGSSVSNDVGVLRARPPRHDPRDRVVDGAGMETASDRRIARGLYPRRGKRARTSARLRPAWSLPPRVGFILLALRMGPILPLGLRLLHLTIAMAVSLFSKTELTSIITLLETLRASSAGWTAIARPALTAQSVVRRSILPRSQPHRGRRIPLRLRLLQHHLRQKRRRRTTRIALGRL